METHVHDAFFALVTDAEQRDAVTQGWQGAIGNIRNPSEQVKLAAVMEEGHAIQYIADPSEAVQLAAVLQNGYVIYYIKNPSEQVQIAAVTKDGWYALQFIKNPSEQVQLAAVTREAVKLGSIKPKTLSTPATLSS